MESSPADARPSLLIVAGEASGDEHAAPLVAALKRLVPGLRVWGIGGDRLAAEGVELLYHARDMGVSGFAEVVRHYPFLRSALEALVARAMQQPPALALLVDYPGFNLRLARRLRSIGVPVAQYIAPQVWAWKEGRVKTMRSVLDDLIVVFPFELDYFRARGISPHYFGHPMAHLAAGEPFRRTHGQRETVAYLPGSRRQELRRHLPIVAGVVRSLGKDLRHRIARAATVDIEELSAGLDLAGLHAGGFDVEIVEGAGEALAGADAAMVKAGTSTLEATLRRIPFVTFYRTSWLSYHVSRMLVTVSAVAMPNLLAGRRIVTELLQKEATPDLLATELRRLLEEGAYRRRVIEDLALVARQLEEGGGSAAAAEYLAARYFDSALREQERV